MSNSIINKEDALEGLLSKEFYFQSLLQLLQSNKLLNLREIQSIQLQLVSIMTETVGYYTKGKSFSVRTETAEQLMLSLCFTLGLFLKHQANLKERISLIKEKGVPYLLAEGEKLLKSRVEQGLALFEAVRKIRLKTKNYAYVDTLDYAIPSFFIDYDLRFASHDIPALIDYPLAIDVSNLAGIEYIEEYLKNLLLENKFCSHFETSEIEALSKGFNKNCDHMLINIFELVLTNSLGCIVTGKLLNSLDISELDRLYLKSIIENLSPTKLEKLFLLAAEKLCRELLIDEIIFIKYINTTVTRLIPEIRRNIETDTLENLFITLDKSENNAISYVDGDSVDNSSFRNITEEIRACSSVEEKIKIIREEFKSFKDLADVLSADCIFADEFFDVFRALNDFEIALLINSISNDGTLEIDYGTESEKEWQEKLKLYLERLEDAKREKLLTLSCGIIL